MRNSRVRVTPKSDVRSWSRREVLARGAGVASVLALPQLWIPKAWGQTATFDYYISTSGNDSNPGTLTQPWALTSLQNTSPNNPKMAGKRVGLIAGNYSMAGITSSHTGPGDYNWALLSIPGGSPGSPTRIASCDVNGNYKARAAKITGPGANPTNALMGGVPNSGAGSSYITIDGIVINGNGIDWGGSGPNPGHVIQFYGSYNPGSGSNPADVTGITVQNCELYGILTTSHVGNNGALIFLEGVHHSLVQNNLLHDANSSASLDQDHVHAIEEYGCHDNQILNNTIYNCSSGIEAKLACTGTIVAYNYFYNVAVGAGGACSVFEGFDGGPGNPNAGPAPITYLIHHNVMDNCGPIHEEDINTNFIGQALNCYNNTVYDTRSGSIPGWQYNSNQPSLVQFYNNIYVSTASAGGGNVIYKGKINVASGGYTVLDYNCYYAANGNYTEEWGLGSNSYSSLSSWQGATGAEAHSMTSNPAFASSITSGAGAAQFQLSSGSPCKSAGRSNGTSSGSVCDMGAWANGTTQVGCNFTPGSTSAGQPVPDAPTLTVS
jgi:hypothetical protein